MDQNQNSSAFDNEQYLNAYPQNYELHYWHQTRAAVLRSLLMQWAPPGAAVLDVGCGPGAYVATLRTAGFNCYGCDLATPKKNKAVAEYIFTGTDFAELSDNLRLQTKTVLLLDVLEHLEHPEQFLTRIKVAFPRLQTVIVTVPARQELWSEYDTYYGHFLRYDIRSLQQLHERSGLDVKHMSYFYHALYVAARLMSWLGHKRKTVFPTPTAPILHEFLGYALHTEWKLLPGKWFGSSLVSVSTINRSNQRLPLDKAK